MANNGIFLSIKPQYADLILNGEKTVELRRVRPKLQPGDLVILYATAPISAILGCFTTLDVITAPIQEIWDTFGPQSSISHDLFFDYFQGVDEGVAILVDKTFRLIPNEEESDLTRLRETYAGFHPPQGYRYIQRLEDNGNTILSWLPNEAFSNNKQ